VAVEPVLIDTAALLALVNADDSLHQRASTAYRDLTIARSPLVLTEWVLAEFLNGASRPRFEAQPWPSSQRSCLPTSDGRPVLS
jgi:predicted nucleic acid-binding protein